jgi:hypothetical protein
MNSDEIDESFLTFSPIAINDICPNPSITSPPRLTRSERDSESSKHAPSDDEDELHADVTLQHLEDDDNEGGFGSDEEVVIASDRYSWKIDHARGDHKFKGTF